MFDLAIYYRMVGGFVGLGLGSTTMTRLRWALAIAIYMTFVSVVHGESFARDGFVFLGVFVAGYAGRLIPHSAFQNVASLKNSIGMSIVEAIRMAMIVAPYAIIGFSHFAYVFERLLVVGLAVGAGVAYYVGNKYLNNKDCGIYYRSKPEQWAIANSPSIFTVPTPVAVLDQCAVGGTEWGELLTGLLCYQAMYMALLVLP